jgi:hypothetical protein
VRKASRAEQRIAARAETQRENDIAGVGAVRKFEQMREIVEIADIDPGLDREIAIEPDGIRYLHIAVDPVKREGRSGELRARRTWENQDEECKPNGCENLPGEWHCGNNPRSGIALQD